jgi:hypothetical protein
MEAVINIEVVNGGLLSVGATDDVELPTDAVVVVGGNLVGSLGVGLSELAATKEAGSTVEVLMKSVVRSVTVARGIDDIG